MESLWINWRKNDIAIRLGKLGVYDFPIVQMPDPRLMDLRNKPFIITLTPGSRNHYTLSIGVTHGSMILATKTQINSILLSRKVPEQAYRSCLGILSLTKTHGNFKLEQACKTANQFGAVSVGSMKNILENKPYQKEQEQQPLVHSNIKGDTEFH